jgi:hypothetical protein
MAAGPVTVADLVAFAGDRVAVMPALYHLLWRGVLAVDLAAAPEPCGECRHFGWG